MTEAAPVIVISDTSPIVNLAVVGQLDLLRQLYNRVIVPAAVHEEISRGLPQLVLAEIASCA